MHINIWFNVIDCIAELNQPCHTHHQIDLMRCDQVFLVACYVYMCRIIVYVLSTYLIIHRCFVPPSEEFALFVAITSLVVLLLLYLGYGLLAVSN
jgi:hypothetical protein